MNDYADIDHDRAAIAGLRADLAQFRGRVAVLRATLYDSGVGDRLKALGDGVDDVWRDEIDQGALVLLEEAEDRLRDLLGEDRRRRRRPPRPS